MCVKFLSGEDTEREKGRKGIVLCTMSQRSNKRTGVLMKFTHNVQNNFLHTESSSEVVCTVQGPTSGVWSLTIYQLQLRLRLQPNQLTNQPTNEPAQSPFPDVTSMYSTYNWRKRGIREWNMKGGNVKKWSK